MMEEIWKPIKGYEGIYEVSSYGRVRSLDHYTTRRGRNGSEHPYPIKGQIQKPRTMNRHFVKVSLNTGHDQRTEYHVHRLVAEAFIQNPDNLPNVLHKNGNITDNRADNLYWGISEEYEGEAEEWRDAEGHEGYQVSNLGRVRSIDHQVTHPTSYSRKDKDYLHHGRILKPYLNKTGYISVSMFNHEKRKMKRVMVHQLVARAFCDGWFEGAVVNHKDENPSNNRADNLEWCTYQHNNTWGNRIDKVKQRFIDSGHARHVAQYDMQGNLIAEYPSVQEAARQTGLRRNSINQVLWGNCKSAKGTIWKYVEPLNNRKEQENV